MVYLFYTLLDMLMCLLWIAAYTFVLIGSIKYKYPLISPITQAFIAPFEFAVFILFVFVEKYTFNYASAAYLYWTAIEIITMVAILAMGAIEKKYIVPYLLFTAFVCIIMIYFVTIKGHVLFFSYFNTFIGELFWLNHIRKDDYPMKPYAIAAFISKLIADFIAVFLYFGNGPIIISAICLMLPMLDAYFVYVWYKRRNSIKQK